MTDIPGYRLAYKDRWLKQYEGAISEDCESSPLELVDDEPTDIVLQVTGDEFRELLACVMLGEGLLYPERQYEIRWLLLKGVECGMLFCERVAECIATSDAVSDALSDWFSQHGGGLGDPLPSQMALQIADGTGCDDSDRFGTALALVAGVDRLVEDLYDFIDLWTEQAELASELLQRIPVLGNVLAAATDLATYYLSTIHTTYSAAYGSTTQTEIACAILCYFNDCNLSLGSMIEAYESLLTSFTPPGPDASLLDFAAWASSVVLSGDLAVVAATQYVVLKLWSVGSTVLNAGPKFLYLAAQGADPADPSGICDDCPATYSRLGGDGDDNLTITIGTYDAGDDEIDGEMVGAYTTVHEVSWDFGTTRHVTRMAYHTHRDPGYNCSGGPTRSRTFALKLSGTTVYEWTRDENNDCTWFERFPDVTADELYIKHQQSTYVGGSNVYIDKIVFDVGT